MWPSDYRKASLRSSSAHPDQARPRCSTLWRHWTAPIAARLLSVERTSRACRGLRQRSIATSASGSSSNPTTCSRSLQRSRTFLCQCSRSGGRVHGAARNSLARAVLGNAAGTRPSELSGGEQQRVAIARALVTDPALILADEPVGNLDDENAGKIAALLARACRERGRTLILVTHDRNLIHPVDHVFDMRSGSL